MVAASGPGAACWLDSEGTFGMIDRMEYVVVHLAAAAALCAAILLGGYALERALTGDRDHPLRALARPVLGVVLWMAALFVFACVGALGTASVNATALACAAAALVARLRWGPAPSAGVGAGASAGFLLAVVLASAPLLLLALSQEVSWDASAYHLTLPRRYLAAGGFVPIEMNVYSNWPLGTELLYAAALAVADHAVAKALHAAFGVATLWAAWLGARTFHRGAAGWLAAPLVLASPVVQFEWSVAYVDLAYAFCFVSGLVFAVHWRTTGGRAVASLWLAGLAGGALASIKLTGPFGAAAIGAVLVPGLVARGRSDGWRAAAGAGLRFAAPVVLLWLPWLVKSAVFTGNPVYPFVYGVFGGPDWSPALADQLASWQRSIGMGRTPADYALLPVRVVLAGGPGYDRFGGVIGPHWLAVVLLALAGLRNPLARGALLASAVYFALWALGSQQMRFLIPILAPLAVAGSIGALELTARVAPRYARHAFAVLMVAATAHAAIAMRAHATRAAALLPRFSAGAQALREEVRQPVDRFVASLPAGARLLLLNTNQGFFLERDFVADSFFEASQIADWLRGETTARGVHARLTERGITHVLRAGISWGIDWPAGLTALLGDPELAPRRYLAEHLSEQGGTEIFELR